MLHSFDSVDFQQIPRSENARIDFLSWLTIAEATDMTRSTYLEVLDTPSLDEVKTVLGMTIEPSLMDPLIAYFTNNHLLKDKMEA